MKTLELTISISENSVNASRTCLVPAQYTFKELHRIIQLLFGLDNVEYYAFKLNNNTYIHEISSGKHNKPAETKLLRLKANDLIHYYYDILEAFDFTIKVNKVIDRKENTPLVLSHKGKNLYEGILHGNFKETRTAFDTEWCNYVFTAFKDKELEEMFRNRIQKAFNQLVTVKNWQDLLYNAVYVVETPQNRNYYFATNCNDEVVVDAYVNEDKLVQFINMNINAMDYSAVRYHDTITLSIKRLEFREDRSPYDFSTSTYGGDLTRCDVFNPHQELKIEELIHYTHAFEKLVHALSDIALKKIKLDRVQVSIDLEGNYKIHPLTIASHSFGLELDFETMHIYNNEDEKLTDTIEIDVVSVYDEEARTAKDFYPVLLLIADEENIEEMRLENCSLKTIAYNIVDMLLTRLLWHGPYLQIKVRDNNMRDILEPFKALGTNIVVDDHLDWLDNHVIATYFDDLLEDDVISKDMIVEQMKLAGLDEDMIRFYENMSEEEFYDLSSHIDEMIDALDEEDWEEPAIDYKKLS